jgi:flagella basal body P-ring formation protein FlgA
VRRTSRLVLLLGVFLAALVFVVILLGMGGNQNQVTTGPTAPPTQLPTLVAAVDIPLGTIVTTDMLTTRTMAVNLRDANVFGDPSQAVGKTTRVAIAATGQVHSK